MKNNNVSTIQDIEAFLQGINKAVLKIATRKERYTFIQETLVKFKYNALTTKKKERGIIKKYIKKMTGYEAKQLKRLIQKWKQGKLVYCTGKVRGAALPKYTPEDIALLIKTDIAHNVRNGHATKETLMREFITFGKSEYENIAHISVSHLYNIRKHKQQYLTSEAIHYTKTNPVSVAIGVREKPRPNGKAGYIRVDSVHQGDKDGSKGVYHINMVDEVTQWEIVGCVPRITDEYMVPLLERMFIQLPFEIINFHSDNGSEYINQKVAEILNRINAKQTKSRSRQSGDQALNEGKNGSVLRKAMGRSFIPKSAADTVEEFYVTEFNPYLNYHRVCSYATLYTDKRGKVRRKYEMHTTPYEKLKLLAPEDQNLKEGVTFAELDKVAYAQSDNEVAERVAKAKSKLFKFIETLI